MIFSLSFRARFNPYRRRELLTYALYLARTHQVLLGLSRFLKISFRRRRKERPPYLADIADAAPAKRPARWECVGAVPILAAEKDSPQSFTLEAPLATKTHTLRPGMSWALPFADREDFYSLHRFGWLFPCLKERPQRARGLFLWSLIENWCQTFSPFSRGSAWDAYSLSERAVHWALFFSILRRSKVGPLKGEEVFLESLRRHGEILSQRLEYHGERTNNHLINNGRALYLLGAFFRHEPWFVAGRRILIEEAARSFTAGGFLREGSSHYQRLLCRRYQEAARIAEVEKDDEFAMWAAPFLKKVEAAAGFFTPEPGAPFPLLGDLSPDSQPGWLGEGWAWLWGERSTFALSSARGPWHDFLDDGWARFDGKNYRLFWHAEPQGAPGPSSHGHLDLGSFDLSWDGKPFLVDTGRSTYEPGPLGFYGLSAASHNAVLIDGHEPFVSLRLNGTETMLPSYRERKVEVRRETAQGAETLTLRHGGFDRLRGVGSFTRRFELTENAITIDDLFEGRGEHWVEARFHLAPGARIKREAGAFQFTFPDRTGACRVSFEGKPATMDIAQGDASPKRLPSGWYAPRYGEAQPISTLRVISHETFPATRRVRLVFT